MRTFYALNSLRQFKNTLEKGSAYKDYWQAGKSVEGIESVEPAGDIIRRFVDFAGR